MNGYCADCHGPLKDGEGVKVVRIVHKACASDHETGAEYAARIKARDDSFDHEWNAQDKRWGAWAREED